MNCDFCGCNGTQIYCINCEKKFHRECYYSCDSCPHCNYVMQEIFDTTDDIICV